MAVTYRAIERYSARRVPSSISSGFQGAFNQTRQIVCRAAAASVYSARLQSILGPSSDPSLLGAIRLWFTNLLQLVYLTFYLASEVFKWSVRLVLTYYYSRPGILCVTFDQDPHRKKGSSCWSLSVYLADCGSGSPSELRRSIVESAKDEPSLKLVRKPEAFGWIHLWQYPDGESTRRMSSVEELPPVWNHQIVTEDSVHEYVSDVCQRPDGLETDGTRPPWRVYLIPLATDQHLSSSSGSNCCLLVRCHQILCRPLDCVIRQAINKQWAQRGGRPAFVRTCKSFESPQRTIQIQRSGKRPVHVSWTRPIPSIDFIDRICLLTRTTCRQIVLAAFCQSINDCYRQSGSSGTLRVEMTTTGSSDDYYTLPIGSSALDDGILVLKTLRQQTEDRNHYRMIPSFRRRNDSSSLLVTMEMVTSSKSFTGIGSQLHWTWLPTSFIPIRLCLWADESTIRLGLIQLNHQLLFPVKADDVERRIHQLAAGLGVQNRRPLSPHSSPSSSPHRLTPPPTPRI